MLVQLLVLEDGVEFGGRYVAPIHGLVFRVVLVVEVLRGHERLRDIPEFFAAVRDESTVVFAPEKNAVSKAPCVSILRHVLQPIVSALVREEIDRVLDRPLLPRRDHLDRPLAEPPLDVLFDGVELDPTACVETIG